MCAVHKCIKFIKYIKYKSVCQMPAGVMEFALNSLAFKRSLPGTWWFFRELMAAMISSFLVVRCQHLGPPQLLVYLAGSSSGGDLLRTSLKCSTQRAS